MADHKDEIEGYKNKSAFGKDKIMEHNTRVEQIKTYLERLSAGEELEKVRADFAKEFKEVDPAEIMQAEQELL